MLRGALSALRAPGGAAREARRRRAVSLRRHHGAVPPLRSADHPDADARSGRRRAAAYHGPGRAHRGQGQLPAAGIDRRAAPRCRCRRCPAIPSSRCRPIARPTSRMVLQSAGVTRAHIHHLMGMDLDVRALLHRLGVPFDVTVHDYFAICPQVNLLPWLQGAYCGEPDARGLQCLHRRPPEPRLARHRVVATRQCLAVHRGRPGDLSQRGRAQAPGALSASTGTRSWCRTSR